jgi:hypothetical protein
MINNGGILAGSRQSSLALLEMLGIILLLWLGHRLLILANRFAFPSPGQPVSSDGAPGRPGLLPHRVRVGRDRV